MWTVWSFDDIISSRKICHSVAFHPAITKAKARADNSSIWSVMTLKLCAYVASSIKKGLTAQHWLMQLYFTSVHGCISRLTKRWSTQAPSTSQHSSNGSASTEQMHFTPYSGAHSLVFIKLLHSVPCEGRTRWQPAHPSVHYEHKHEAVIFAIKEATQQGSSLKWKVWKQTHSINRRNIYVYFLWYLIFGFTEPVEFCFVFLNQILMVKPHQTKPDFSPHS